MSFELLDLLRADLRRLWGQVPPPSGIRLWLRLVHPRFVPVLLLRVSALLNPNIFLRPIALILSLINVVLFGLEVTPRCRIGGGLFLPHTSGTVIGAVEIGRNATIFQGATLGAKFADVGFDSSMRPTIGDDVLIGAGAKVLGGIRIGSRAVIAANSLVVQDVVDGAYMIGVPAQEKRLSG